MTLPFPKRVALFVLSKYKLQFDDLLASNRYWAILFTVACVWIVCQTDSWTALTFDITVTCVWLCIFFAEESADLSQDSAEQFEIEQET